MSYSMHKHFLFSLLTQKSIDSMSISLARKNQAQVKKGIHVYLENCLLKKQLYGGLIYRLFIVL